VSGRAAEAVGVVRVSVLCAPLRVKGSCWAVMAAHAPAGHRLRPGDVERFQTLAYVVASAIENQMLSDELAGRDPFRLAARGRDRSLKKDLETALRQEQFRLVYQPVVDLQSGGVAGAEALLRWDHPDLGRLCPADFIPAAEESGLIVPLGEWVIRQVCEELTTWTTRRVSVNISPVQLTGSDLPMVVAAALARSGLDPDQLVLEITETALISDQDRAARALWDLKRLGVLISIDDFGTGYSSLSYLKHFPVDSVKVDRSFIAGLGRDPDDAVIVSAVVHLARALGLATVGEGVETRRQALELKHLGCDLGQGFFFHRPGPAGEALGKILSE
jgi:EAL domain-containing protein (putative c-di-GMP-specific phosphodiesterase class I)